MDGGTNFNVFFAAKYNSKPKHLGAIGLHLEISNGPGFSLAGNTQAHTKTSRHSLSKERVVTDPFNPFPVVAIKPLVLVQQAPGFIQWLLESTTQALGGHLVLDRQNACFVELSDTGVRIFASIWGGGPGQFCETQIRIA